MLDAKPFYRKRASVGDVGLISVENSTGGLLNWRWSTNRGIG